MSREPTTHAIREEKCLYFFVALREKLLYGIMVALSRKRSKGLNQVDPFFRLFISFSTKKGGIKREDRRGLFNLERSPPSPLISLLSPCHPFLILKFKGPVFFDSTLSSLFVSSGSNFPTQKKERKRRGKAAARRRRRI